MLHPQAAAALAADANAETGPGSVAAARARLAALVPVECGDGPELALVDDVDVGGVPCRRYHPWPGRSLPVVVYLHGGGWALGNRDTTDAVCRRVAARSGCAVLSVDYRLAPEHPWPAAVEDVDAVLEDVDADASARGFVPTRVALAGDSAGATLAAVAARRARDAGRAVSYQALVYPAIDVAMDSPSFARYGVGYGNDAADLAAMWAAYLPDPRHHRHPDATPGSAPDLTGLPPALVLTAGCDPLRDEAEAYANRLARAGVPTTLVRYPGMVHGFFRKLALFDAAQVAVDQVAAALQAALVPGGPV